MMCTKGNGLKLITEITNSILFFISTSHLYIKDIAKEDVLFKRTEKKRDEELTKKTNEFLIDFAIKNNFWDHIVQYGMTFAKDNRTEPYFFDARKNNIETKFETWFASYKNREKVPLWINELLCREAYWNIYKFPMIILYCEGIPYFIQRKDDAFNAIKMDAMNYATLFKQLPSYPTLKADIEKLHASFKNEEYSEFKVFFTSNFRDMRSQTFIKFNKPLCDINIDSELTAFIKMCFLIDTAIGSAIYDFDRIINYHEYTDEILKHGTKAAVSAIMSRNMSHNIGSHAISLWNMQLNEQLKDKSDTDQGIEPLKSVKDSKALFQYLQHRMDFIAEVSTSVPSSEMTMNFKNDIMQPFIDQKVLFKNIAASEGIEVTIENKDVVIPKDCERVSIPNGIIGTHAVYSIFENFIRNAAKHYKGTGAGFKIKVELKIPSSVRLKNKAEKLDNDNYTIVNNILTVKKNSDETTHILTKKEQDEITKFNEYADKNILDRFFFIHEHYIEMHIWDMRCNSCDKVSVDDKTTTVVEKLREYLDLEKSGKFIDEEGRLQAGGWGFKEMITSANFLRKNPTDKIIEQMDEKEPPFMQIICGDGDNEPACKEKACHRTDDHKNKLGVLFYLRKPKDMLVLGEDLADKITKDKFEIEAADPASWPPKNGKLAKDIPHRLLLVPDAYEEEKYANDPKAPMRIMIYNNVEKEKGFDDKDYLKKYEDFIKTKLNPNQELPTVNFFASNKEVLQCFVHPELKEKYTNGSKKDKIIFLHHSGKKEMVTVVSNYLDQKQYFQPMSGAYPFNSRINQLPNADKQRQENFLLELIEMGLAKIIIIDERISDLAKLDAFHSFKIGTILKNMRIDVVDVDKKKITLDELSSKLDESQQYHFLIIHQGILDKLETHKKDSSKELMKKIHCNWKIVDSGRGVPPELEHYSDVRFVEISSLLKMLETYDKHALVQTLFSLRRPNISNNG